jgi:hypothetical protein
MPSRDLSEHDHRNLLAIHRSGDVSGRERVYRPSNITF